MKITDLKVVSVAVPFARFGEFKPVTMWYRTRYASRHAIVFIETDEGITGVGSTEENDEYDLVNSAKPRLVGKDPHDVELLTNMHRDGLMQGAKSSVVHAIDTALWDIIGKSCGKPLYKLWGGKVHDKVRVRYWMPVMSPQEQAEEAVKAVQRGWKGFKVKLGTDPKTDIQRVKAVRQAVGDDIDLGFDINGSYNLPTAIKTLKQMEPYNPAHIEEPIPGNDLDGMTDLKQRVCIPIEAHLSAGPNTMEYVQALVTKRAADILHLNPIQVGGVLEAKRLCALADAAGIPVTCQSSCAELGPSNALLLHWITSTPSFTMSNDSSTHHLEPPSGDIIKNEFRTVNSCLNVPEGPGLGIEIDPAKLEKYHQIWLNGQYKHVKGLPRSDTYYW